MQRLSLVLILSALTSSALAQAPEELAGPDDEATGQPAPLDAPAPTNTLGQEAPPPNIEADAGGSASPESSPRERTIVRLSEAAGRSIVGIWCGDARWGTGFAFGSQTQIATARHVAVCPRAVRVETLDGRRSLARVVALGDGHDVALLETEDDLGLEPIELREAPVELGLRVYVSGFPANSNDESLGLTVTSGIVAHKTPELVDADIAVSHGSSGSPLLDSDLQLVGVLFGTDGLGMSRSVATEHLRALSGQNNAEGDARNPLRLSIGAHVGMLGDNGAAMFGGQVEFGVSLHDEWSLRLGAGYYARELQSIVPEPLATTRSAMNAWLGAGYRMRFELGEGFGFSIEPYLGAALTYLQGTRTTYTLGLADPTCSLADQMCAITTSESMTSSEEWRVQPLLGLRLIASDFIHIGYQFQLNIDNPEASGHLLTFGISP